MQNKRAPSNGKIGVFTENELNVLRCRGKGMSQQETAVELHTTRANVSMIERRARRNLERARETLKAYELTLTDHAVIIEVGTRSQEIPGIVLREGDRFGTHIQSDLVDIVRMVRSLEPICLTGGKTNRCLRFTFNQSGKLSLAEESEVDAGRLRVITDKSASD